MVVAEAGCGGVSTSSVGVDPDMLLGSAGRCAATASIGGEAISAAATTVSRVVRIWPDDVDARLDGAVALVGGQNRETKSIRTIRCICGGYSN